MSQLRRIFNWQDTIFSGLQVTSAYEEASAPFLYFLFQERPTYLRFKMDTEN